MALVQRRSCFCNFYHPVQFFLFLTRSKSSFGRIMHVPAQDTSSQVSMGHAGITRYRSDLHAAMSDNGRRITQLWLQCPPICEFPSEYNLSDREWCSSSCELGGVNNAHLREYLVNHYPSERFGPLHGTIH